MRTDWLPLSASALVIGAMALVLGGLLNPSTAGQDAAQTLHVVQDNSGRWLGMAVMYFLASFAMTLGLPAVLSLFTRRGRRLGLLAVGVLSLGVIGTAGYAMLMVFFRALVVKDLVKTGGLDQLAHDAGLGFFLYGWIGGFYLGVALLALALLVARSTARWVPAVLVLFVLMLPVASHLGRLGSAVQVLLLAVAFTGIAVAAVSEEHQRDLRRQPVF
ncbi:MAG: hypothetical protein ACXVW8_17180 [Nocardioidaceae bacterium]